MLSFSKYQGTGNDFIMVDDRNGNFPIEQEHIAQLCDRRFGIGADGLILLQNGVRHIRMIYYNSDGKESTMCGNGGRCFIQYASDLGLMKKKLTFEAIDGLHTGEILDHQVKLQMKDVNDIRLEDSYTFMDTGSPHHVEFRKNLEAVDVNKEGACIRYSDKYPEGTNVNFIHQLTPNRLEVRTYERGVESETLSCGTGVTAPVLTLAARNLTQVGQINVKTRGGNLQVHFEQSGEAFTNIYLIGPAKFVFRGKVKI